VAIGEEVFAVKNVTDKISDILLAKSLPIG
jgi:hypothetical protein